MRRNFVILVTTLILTGLLGVASMSFAQQGKWAKKAEMPTPRAALTASVVNGLIYVIGGWNGNVEGNDPEAETALPTVEVYNPATDQWKKVADLPTPRARYAAAMVDGKIYVFGGRRVVDRRGKKVKKTLKSVEVYDPAADAWEQKADAPVARYRTAAAVIKGKIYILGGDSNVGELRTLVEVYDPATDTWGKAAKLIERRSGSSAAVVNGKIYAFGGFRKEQHWVEIVEEYDPAADKWTKKRDMPTPRQDMSPTSPAVNGKIYLIGGDNNNQLTAAVEEYDSAKNEWVKQKKMPTVRDLLAAVQVKGKIYAIGGVAAGGGVLGTVEEYTPDGWPFAVGPQGKLAITWGTIKATD